LPAPSPNNDVGLINLLITEETTKQVTLSRKGKYIFI
jgi:hypothetical protein